MIYVTYQNSGENDISNITNYFYNEEDAKEYAILMGEEYMIVHQVSKEHWPEKLKCVYCTAWPVINEIKTDIKEYEILSSEIGAVKTELVTNSTNISKYFLYPKEKAEKEFNEILNEYKAILRPSQHGNLQLQIVRKDLEGLLQKTIEEKECWGTQEDWSKYEAYKSSESAPRYSAPMFSGGSGVFTRTPIVFTDSWVPTNLE